jgi:autotransporter-associated beta strand protein
MITSVLKMSEGRARPAARRQGLVAAGIVLICLAPGAGVGHATEYTWSGADGATWDTTATNWTGASGTPWDSTSGSGNVAIFSNTTSGSVSVANVTTNGITLSRATTLSGGTVSLAGTSPTITSSITGSVLNTSLVATDLQIRVDAGSSTLALSGSNTLSGTTLVTSLANNLAALSINSTQALGSGAVSIGNLATDAAYVVLNATGAYANAFQLNGLGGNTGYGRIRFGANNVELTGPITLNGDSRIVGANFPGRTAAINGVISGSHALELRGGNASNTWTFNLGGANTFTGGLTIGPNLTATLTNAAALNATVGEENAVSLSQSSSRLNLNGNSVVIASLTGTSGAIVRNANATPATLTVGNSLSQSGTFAGILEDGEGGGSLSLVKAGGGTLTLSESNSFTGSTTVSGGTLGLAAAGAVAGSSGLDIASGATLDLTALGSGFTLGTGQSLGGAGSILGDVVFGAGSKLAFSTTDTLTISGGTLSFFAGTAGSRFGIDDLIGISASTPLGTYTLISGTVDTSNLDNFGPANPYVLGDGKTAYFEQGSLEVVVVPEPGGLLLAALGITALGCSARRR